MLGHPSAPRTLLLMLVVVAAANCGPAAPGADSPQNAMGDATQNTAPDQAIDAGADSTRLAVDGAARADAPAPSQRPGNARSILLDPSHPAWSEPAPAESRIRFVTTRGDFVVELVRAWAPIGVDRFYNLIRFGYYDDVRLHRVVPGFITQWGVSGDPELNEVWYDRGMPDDTVVASNTRGTLAFAFTAPGTRTTQVYISMVDNSRLDAQGFAPLGRVVEGMEEVVDSIYSGYGESSGGGVRNGDQSRIVAEGNAWLDANHPLLDRIIRAEILGG